MTRDGSEDSLEGGRAAYERHDWRDAYSLLSRADEADALAGPDLELLATSAYMLGRDDEYLRSLERAHHAYLESGETLRAVRCAFWVGVNLAIRGETGPAGGWLGRAHRLMGDEDTVERGYLLMPLVFQHEAAGDFTAAAAVAADAATIAERFHDAEAFAMAVYAQGSMLIKAGRVNDGLGLLDEAMVAVAGGTLSPIATGIVYCGVILACQEVYELRRAREWTAVLTRWCEGQPDLVAFTGRCLVHRAEIMQLRGDWSDALEEARRAGERLARSFNRPAAAQAFYRQGEVHRLRGEFPEAESAYREASRFGWEPQPGMALLRLAQGRGEAAVASIRRALDEATQPLRRANLLPAYVEIRLAADSLEEARMGCDELEEIASRYESEMLAALVAHARGASELAAGDARSALVLLREAAATWQGLDAPYDAARVRVLVAQACRALGDDDTAALELEAARELFAELGAAPDLARLGSSATDASGRAYGLTPRQVEVLRLVAAGKSNREIAELLVISEHTVARHVQNIFATLRVSSRTAASAFAFEHDLA
ncbi:MAG TPA: LuxR C-terminal-related transcriptional regulator [Gaiellaceae bacterium]|nr:LuxR C-terminal-related transcriptional regulator [Gaiellaceae bacterium]